MNADLMFITLTTIVVVDGCDLVSIAQLVVRAGLIAMRIVVGNLDIDRLLSNCDVMGGT